MNSILKVMIPVALLGLSGVASAGPLESKWFQMMEKKFPEWHQKGSAAWKALEAARAAWKDVDGAWKKISKDKAAKPEDKSAAYTKRHETLLPLRAAEIAWHQFHIDWKNDEVKRYTEKFNKWKEKQAAKPAAK